MTSEPQAESTATARATWMLVLTTLVWGMSFPWTKSWQLSAVDCPGGELIASFTLIGVRLSAALFLLGLWQPRLLLAPSRREHAAGAIIGAVFFLGFSLQVWGLAHTTPALSAFFTSLSSAWVPLIGWIALRLNVSRLTLAGLLVALAGTAVLVEGGWKIGLGEQLTFLAALAFSVQILLIDRLGKRVRSSHITAAFMGTAGLLALVGATGMAVCGPGLSAWLGWLLHLLRQPAVLANLICLILLPTVLGFYWMNSYQPLVSANRAALIYLLEPVFASILSVGWGYEPMTAHLLLGGFLILAGNLLVELPGWLRQPRKHLIEEQAE
jgi:drug/metabolite transporter (DMT)-like permease